MKLLKIHIIKKQDYFQQHFKTNVEIIQMNLRTYQMKSKQLFLMAMEQGLYKQVVMILQRESNYKKEKDKTKIYIFQGCASTWAVGSMILQFY